ncbi:MAG: hypothetical protein GY826_14920, partial [Fuerstiella sp.]|nr:hypothetical protein [Fuerstiella sp.]
MTDANPSRYDQPFWVVGCAAIWVVVFLVCFFNQILPNNSSSVETLTRGRIWEYILGDWPTILNPLDYSGTAGPQSGWHNMGQRVPFIRTAAVLWFAAWCLGRFAVGLVLGPVQLLRSERTVFDFGAGLSLLTLWTLLCGLAGQLHSSILLIPSGVAFTVLMVTRITRFRSNAERCQIPRTAAHSTVNRGMFLLLIVLPAPFVLHIFLGGMTPPFDFDVCEYHLQG